VYGKRHILEIEVRSNFYAAYLIQITSNMIHPIYSDRRREDIGGKEGGRQWAALRLCASASKFGGDVSNTMVKHQRRFRDGRGGTSTCCALLVAGPWSLVEAQQLVLLFTVTCSFSFSIYNLYAI